MSGSSKNNKRSKQDEPNRCLRRSRRSLVIARGSPFKRQRLDPPVVTDGEPIEPKKADEPQVDICSICLEQMEEKGFANNCLHQFCFECLMEWSKEKALCPLCKKSFTSILHNVDAMNGYDEFKIKPTREEVSLNPLEYIFGPFEPTDYEAIDDDPVDARSQYRLSEHQIQRRSLFQLFRRESPLILQFHRTYPDDIYPLRRSGVEWRKYVYLRKLYALPLSDRCGEFRDVTASNYRFNPPLLHRVSQWLKRDLASLVATEQMWTPTLAFIIRCMIKYDITSDEFISNIARAMPDHYEHFVHELINFAKSPSEMSQYDRDVGYLPKLDNPPDDSDIDDERPYLPVVRPVNVEAIDAMSPMELDSSENDDDTTNSADSRGNGAGSSTTTN